MRRAPPSKHPPIDDGRRLDLGSTNDFQVLLESQEGCGISKEMKRVTCLDSSESESMFADELIVFLDWTWAGSKGRTVLVFIRLCVCQSHRLSDRLEVQYFYHLRK